MFIAWFELVSLPTGLRSASDLYTFGKVKLYITAVNDKTKVTIEVPVNFINENLSPGIKRGGVLNVVRYTVEVICPVNKIPEKFEFNLEGLEIGDSIHISHTKIEEGVETTIKDRDFTVASILAPSALVSSESTEEKTEEEEEGKEEDKAEESKTEDKESK